jgi:Glycosyl-transferase for dystroglycan
MADLIDQLSLAELFRNFLQGILWAADSAMTFTENEEVEAAKEAVQVVAKSDMAVGIRERPSSACTNSESLASSMTTTTTAGTRDCEEFRRAARLKRRTHLYFVSSIEDIMPEKTPTSGTAIDVTLATQLTIDRFAALERMLSSWNGPASVALHVTDEEADRLPSMISTSAALKDRKQVSYHVVYKRLVRAMMKRMQPRKVGK